jgi:hypothetical protein
MEGNGQPNAQAVLTHGIHYAHIGPIRDLDAAAKRKISSLPGSESWPSRKLDTIPTEINKARVKWSITCDF